MASPVSEGSKASELATRSTNRVTRTEHHGEFVYKQKVRVISDKWPKFSKLSFEFLCHARNNESGHEWYELYGGLPGHAGVRAFGLDAVRPRS